MKLFNKHHTNGMISAIDVTAIVSLAIVLGVFMWWPLQEAAFDVINDHAIVSLFIEAQPFVFFDIPTVWLNSEGISHPFESTRYQPSY